MIDIINDGQSPMASDVYENVLLKSTSIVVESFNEEKDLLKKIMKE